MWRTWGGVTGHGPWRRGLGLGVKRGQSLSCVCLPTCHVFAAPSHVILRCCLRPVTSQNLSLFLVRFFDNVIDIQLHGRVVKGAGHLGHEEAMEAGGRKFDPRPGHYSRMSF